MAADLRIFRFPFSGPNGKECAVWMAGKDEEEARERVKAAFVKMADDPDISPQLPQDRSNWWGADDV